MKIIFVSSGNRGNISPIVKNQGDSILKYDPGISIEYLLVNGKGVIGYLKNIPNIRKKVKAYKPNIIHAHYSFCGILAAIAFVKTPIIVSLMGSDIKVGGLNNLIIRIFSKFFWGKTIVKSEDSKRSIKLLSSNIIPNGVDLDKFYPMDKESARAKLNWDFNSIIILFAANPLRPEKNWQLVEKVINKLNCKVEVKFLKDIPNGEVVYHYNAADVVILASLWEGSPNVVKEAMACNRPIVSTDVGDVKEVMRNVYGCFISSFNEDNIKKNILNAIKFSETSSCTNGREKIKEISYDSYSIAEKVIKIYKSLIKSV